MFAHQLARRISHATRGYATGPSASSSNLPLYLGLAGLAGLGGYVYLQRNPPAKAAVIDKAQQLNPVGASSALSKDNWTPFILSKVEPYNHNSKVYHFSFGEGGEEKVSGGSVAHCLLVRTPEGPGEILDDKGKPVIRPYTPVSPPDQKGEVTLLIKEYKGGALTPYISNLEIGKPLLFKGPNPKHKYEPGQFDRGLCVAGGSGITPMYQMIRHSLGISDDKTQWTLVFANVSEADILLRKEWESLAQQHPDRLKVHYVLDKAPRGWKGETGYVTKDMIQKVFPKGEDKVKAFVCGPPPQVKAVAGPKDGFKQGEVQGILKDLGYVQEEVYKF